MPYSRIYVDQFLLNWGDKLFFEPYQRPKQREAHANGWVVAAMAFNIKTRLIREQIKRTTKKAPEVMVKITSRKGAGRGMKAIRAHLEYISRNNRVELEDHEGQTVGDRTELRELENSWQQIGGRFGRPMPEESRYREAFNVIFSMPQGTPANKVKEAARDFFDKEFSGRSYVFALHEDTFKPHVHLCILAQSSDPRCKRLNPRKKDLQHWREGFAESLREHGIEANATGRVTRGETKFSIPQERLHMARRLKLALPEVSTTIEKSVFKPKHDAWREISSVLLKSEEERDQEMGRDVYKFWAGTPVNLKRPAAVQLTSREKERHDGRRTIAQVFQSHIKTVKRDSPAQGISDLRTLSGITMVHNIKRAEMLLHHDACNSMERKGRAYPRVRR